MQRLTTAPRDHLTRQQVTDLLTGDQVEVDFGAELLTSDLTFREDISDDLQSAVVERRMDNRIHGTARLRLSRKLVWGVDLVRTYMSLSDGAIEARFNTGVWMLTTPERVVGEDPPTYDVSGSDRLALLDRQVGDDYTVTAGTVYRDALLQVFTDAGLTGVAIEGTAADDTLPKDKTWPLVAEDTSDPDQTTTPATWLRVINDLLTPINFRGVWADHNGLFRCQAYQPPDRRGVEFSFDTGGVSTIVGEDRTLISDVWATPNRWVFRQSNRPAGAPAPTEGDGIYTVDLSDPTDGDWLGRKLVWTKVIDYEAASQAKLVSLGDRRVARDRRTTARLQVDTGPFPAAGHGDVFSFRDRDAGTSQKVQAIGWELDHAGGDTRWDWEEVSV